MRERGKQKVKYREKGRYRRNRRKDGNRESRLMKCWGWEEGMKEEGRERTDEGEVRGKREGGRVGGS